MCCHFAVQVTYVILVQLAIGFLLFVFCNFFIRYLHRMILGVSSENDRSASVRRRCLSGRLLGVVPPALFQGKNTFSVLF